LPRYAAGVGRDAAQFEDYRAGPLVLGRVRRDIDSGMGSGQRLDTPTLFIDGVVNRGLYEAASLIAALAR
jgi:hypothetical protein